MRPAPIHGRWPIWTVRSHPRRVSPSCTGIDRTDDLVADWRFLRWRCSSPCHSATSISRTFTDRRARSRLRSRRPSYQRRMVPVRFLRTGNPTSQTITARFARLFIYWASLSLPKHRNCRCHSLSKRSSISHAMRPFSSRPNAHHSSHAPHRSPDLQSVLIFVIAASCCRRFRKN